MPGGDRLRDRFTLLVPTYNRPAELERLLVFLQRQRVTFEVIVLDSSNAAVQEQNAAAVSRLQDVHVRRESFGAEMSPWDKFRRGSDMVRTEFCALCADDDVVVPASLEPLLAHLTAHPDYSVAHGWYFTFHKGAEVRITEAVYRGPSLDHDDPLARLHALFRSYEAVTYAVYRTAVLRRVLREVQDVRSLMARELLGGALAVALGKVARLPVLYYGRSLAPSQFYVHWHPLEFLASSPDAFYADYAVYRRLLVQCLQTDANMRYGGEELYAIVDLIHLRYLSEYIKPAVMDHLIECAMARVPKEATMQGVWSLLLKEGHGLVARMLGGNRALRRMRDRFFPRIRWHTLRRFYPGAQHRTIHSTTAAGLRRDYVFYGQFLAQVKREPGLARSLESLCSTLDCYD